MRRLFLLLLAFFPLAAHVGSPDVFFDGMAGPYSVLIVIRPPVVIPGTAQVEVRTSTPGVRTVKILPMPLTGAGSKFPPTADVATRSPADPKLFSRFPYPRSPPRPRAWTPASAGSSSA
jgi:hypothetical protein